MPAEAAPAEGAGEEAPKSWEDRAWSIGKQVLMFIAAQYAIKTFMSGGKQATPAPNADGSKAPEVDYSVVFRRLSSPSGPATRAST